MHALQKQGVGISLDSHKHALAHIADLGDWDVSEKAVHFQYQGQYHRFAETVTPASQMQLTAAHLPEALQGEETGNGIFPDVL